MGEETCWRGTRFERARESRRRVMAGRLKTSTNIGKTEIINAMQCQYLLQQKICMCVSRWACKRTNGYARMRKNALSNVYNAMNIQALHTRTKVANNQLQQINPSAIEIKLYTSTDSNVVYVQKRREWAWIKQRGIFSFNFFLLFCPLNMKQWQACAISKWTEKRTSGILRWD